MFLVVNEIIEYDDGTRERVLWIDEENINTFCILLNNKKSLPIQKKVSDIILEIQQGTAKKIEDDTYIRLIKEDELSERDIKDRDKRWEIISKLVSGENIPKIFYQHRRGPLIEAAMKEHNVSKPSVYKYLRRYWIGGQIKNSLVSNFHASGGKGKSKNLTDIKVGRPRKNIDLVGIGTNITEENKKIFNISIDKFYDTSQKNPLSVTYQLMIEEYYTERVINDYGVEVNKLKENRPTIEQLRYWHKKGQNIKKEIISRKGSKKYNLEHRAILGSSTKEAFGPGALYQIDATIADVYLVSRFNRNWIIGRPVLYIVMDVYSRMITGMYVGLEGPSWAGAMMALANCGMDKVKFCKQYGIEINDEQWNTKYLPQSILADRGELEGVNIETLIDAFGIDVKNTPAYRADWKGIVERHFATIHGKIKPFVPGFIEKDFRERGSEDYRLNATLDIEEFTKIIIYCILEHNNTHYLDTYVRDPEMIKDNVKCIPKEIWSWGIKNKTGLLRSFDDDLIRLNLMPIGIASVTSKGIKFKNIFYTCKTAIEDMWFEKARMNGRWKLEVSYDPRNMDYIYIKKSERRKFEKCTLLSREDRFLNKSLDEIIYLIEEEKRLHSSNKQNQLQGNIDLNTKIQEIVKEAEQKNIFEGIIELESKSQKTKSIKVNRRYEKSVNRHNESFDLDDDIFRTSLNVDNEQNIDNVEKNETHELYNSIYENNDCKENIIDEEFDDLDLFKTIQTEAFNDKQ